jgi:predicted transcriptional regulator of viral defense system
MIDQLRAAVPHEEFDYQILIHALREYASPRDHATRLLKQGAIVRVKKGLYVFGPTLRRSPYSRELLANLISGPSYVSLGYALGFHGLIPERATTVTSVTVGKRRVFATPVGRFKYWPVPPRVFGIGISRMTTPDGRAFLMATREKALCDTLVHARSIHARSGRQLEAVLADDLRVDLDELASFDTTVIAELARSWPSRRLALLVDVVDRLARAVRREREPTRE